jgi:histone deacetylase complex regulatory component SIN3
MHFIGKPKEHVKVQLLTQNGTKVADKQQQECLDEALRYLDQVKKSFESSPQTFQTFICLMREFKDKKINSQNVVDQVKQLFTGHEELLDGKCISICY